MERENSVHSSTEGSGDTEGGPKPELAAFFGSCPSGEGTSSVQESGSAQRVGRADGANNYDHETVVLLIRALKEEGYGNRGLQRKSLQDVFEHCVKIAEEKHGIKRTAKGWRKTFTRMKQ